MSSTSESSPYQTELRQLFYSVSSPVSFSATAERRIVSCEDFIRIVEEKMAEAYEHGIRACSRGMYEHPVI